MSAIHWYGKPGTLNDMVTMQEDKAKLMLPDYVKMEVLSPPNDGGLYVISPTGAWERATDDALIKAERERRYLEAYPIPQQLEAMADKENGDATKWNEMQKAFEKIREDLPYVNRIPSLS